MNCPEDTRKSFLHNYDSYSMNIPNFDSAKITEILTGPNSCIYLS